MSVLPDVLAPGLRIVFCGTAAGNESARRGHYYAGRGNAFWPTLHAVGLTPRELKPREFRLVLDYGIGLTNLATEISNMERKLVESDFDVSGLKANVETYSPRILAFTSKNSAQVFLGRHQVPYGLQPDTLGETQVFVLPSPAGMARGHWDEQHWHDLARL